MVPTRQRIRGSTRRRRLGVEKGHRVVLYMPMIPEAVVAMLACARLGAVHSVVFGGFASHGSGHPHRRCAADGDRVGVLRIEPTRLVEYKPMLDHALTLSATSRACRSSARWSSTATLAAGRDHDWAG